MKEQNLFIVGWLIIFPLIIIFSIGALLIRLLGFLNPIEIEKYEKRV